MKMKSHYGDLAINLLSGRTEHSQTDTLATNYGRKSAGHERNECTLSAVICMTNSTGEKQPPTPFIRSTKGSKKAVQNRQQNASKNRCTDLVAEYVFSGVSKDIFRHPKPTNFGCFRAQISACSDQKNRAANGKSAHNQFFQIQRRQGVKFCGRTGSAGESLPGQTRVFIKLTKFMISQTTTLRANG